jgi:hypothetical protein
MQGDLMRVILKHLAERIGKPNKLAHPQPRCRVLWMLQKSIRGVIMNSEDEAGHVLLR